MGFGVYWPVGRGSEVRLCGVQASAFEASGFAILRFIVLHSKSKASGIKAAGFMVQGSRFGNQWSKVQRSKDPRFKVRG